MVTNRCVQRAMFNSLSRPCEVTNVLGDIAVIDVGVDMLSGVGIILMANPAITVELVVRITDTVEMLFEVMTVTIFGIVPVSDVDMLTDENVHGLAAMMTPLEFNLPTP